MKATISFLMLAATTASCSSKGAGRQSAAHSRQPQSTSLAGKEFCGTTTQLSGGRSEDCIKFSDDSTGQFTSKSGGTPETIDFTYSAGQGEVTTVVSEDPIRVFVQTYTISEDGKTLTRKDDATVSLRLKESSVSLIGKTFCGTTTQLSGGRSEDCIRFSDDSTGQFTSKSGGTPETVEFTYSVGQGEVTTVVSEDPLRVFVQTYTMSADGKTLARKDAPSVTFRLKQ